MADKPKRTILVKGNCENCMKPVGVEVIEPDPVVQIVKEPCKCGMDSESRSAKYVATAVATAVVSVVLAFGGSCVSNHYFTTQQIRAAKGDYKIQENGKDYYKSAEEPMPVNSPDFRVVPKPAEPKKEEKK
jgi:hypothetical protein